MIPLIQHRNRIIRVDNTRLASNALAKTFLSAAMSAASGTLTVKDIAGFAIAKFVWINPFGANSEIIAVHASTAPSGNTLTLAANTAFAHAAGEEVLYIEFNQIEFNHAASVGGSKTVLATNAVIAREKETVYLDITQTSGYYSARFKNSVATTYSSYSDETPYGGWEKNTAGYMIDRALRDTKNKLGNNITLEDCLAWITDGLDEVKGKLKQWPEHFVYDYALEATYRGYHKYSLPTNIYDSETNRSIETFKIGDQRLRYVDPDQFDLAMGDAIYTEARLAADSGDTAIEVVNSFDFEVGYVSTFSDDEKYSVYVTNILYYLTTGTFYDIPTSGDGSLPHNVSIGDYIWQNEVEGTPEIYTVRNGEVEFWPLPSTEYLNKTIKIDYATEITEANSESDTIDSHRFDLIKAYLTWRIWCKADNNGKLDETNGWYRQYKERLNDAIRTLPTKKTKWSPNINTMSRRGSQSSKPDPRLIPNSEQ